MYCGKCGSEIEDNARFCGKCGATVELDYPGAPASAADAVAAIGAAGAQAESHMTENPSATEAKPRKKVIIIAVAAIAVVAIACRCIYAFVQHKAYEEAHEPVAVSLGFSFAATDGTEASADAMPIGVPVVITGTDLDGNAVEERFLAASSGEQRELLQGTYELAVVGDPITAGGTVYACEGEDASCTLAISFDGEGAKASATDIGFEFAALSVTDVTDEVLADIRSWTGEFDVSTAEVDAAIKAATDKREAELARIAAEQERARQEAEAARLEQEKQAALAANPTYIGGTSEMNHSQTARLTGVVRNIYTHVEGMIEWGYVCYLELPANVTVDGSQYGPQTSNKIILPEEWASYAGKTITISSFYVISSTGSIPSAAVSSIHAARGAEVIRVW